MTGGHAPGTISVVCPVHNTDGQLLTNAVESVIAEPEDGVVEIILVDDASTRPETMATLSDLQGRDRRVRVVRLEPNRGPASARNAGIAQASGEWIGFLDSDDLWLPGRTAFLRRALAILPTATWVAGRYQELHPDGSLREGYRLEAQERAPGLPPPWRLLGGSDLTRQFLPNSGKFTLLGQCLVRCDAIRQAGGLYDGTFYFDDVLFFLRLSIRNQLLCSDEPVYLYRQTPNGVTSSGRMLSYEYVRPIDLALQDEALADYKRELRWGRYSALKHLAARNLLIRRYLAAWQFACQAFVMDPRTLPQFLTFVTATLNATRRDAALTRYRRAK